MKKILMISLLFSLTAGFMACEDQKDEFLSDYSTILYFRNSGEMPLTLYKTGEDTAYQLTVNKSGSDRSSTTEVEVAVLDDAALEAYNVQNGTSFVKLPENCYQLADNQLVFDSDNLYKMANIVFKTDLIYDLPAGKEYVLPVSLVNVADSINSEKDKIILVPSVMIPSVYFGQTGFVSNTFTDEGDAQAKFTLPVSIPMASKWTFDCTVAVDESLLEEYNKKNDTNYSILPGSVYSLSGDGAVSFVPDDNSKDLEITVDRTKLEYGNFVLPLRLAGCSKEGFVIDDTKNTCLYGISYVPDESKLKKVELTAGMLSSNAVEPSEGALANLLDGDVETYFHSAWSVAVEGTHYLQVALPTETTAFNFYYTTRSANGSAAPVKIIIEGSLDGVSFNQISTLTDGLPTGGKETYNSKIMVGKPFKIIRFSVPENASGGNYFVWSEFGMKVF
ncbi:DUF1735 domain-containing protein [Parabacteroides sp. AF18-52]|jgi:hypothetical protein|uniref:BT_3987 domain-containing protein n=1 Tax=Parabacteroides TaxID=375288 RepID=UPI000EFFD523|nr:DUF1735 domain-containing protein [Parabacteroides sp. AF18-52]RHR35027.1 DUF1735 domain-containing protein [Parabacteroides sp. AF18-52]